MTPTDRFWSNVDKKSSDECWNWKLSRNNFGYGKLTIKGRYYFAHRMAYALTKGEIPSGLCVLHKCENPICTNPNHLFLGTQKQKASTRRNATNKKRWGNPVDRFWKCVDKNGPIPEHQKHLGQCWIWTAYKDRNGYGFKSWNKRPRLAHRISWTLSIGEIPDGLGVLHKCDNPSCVNPSHLFLGTHQDNASDKQSKGRGNQPKGSAHNKAKLTEENVLTLRVRFARGEKVSHVASELGMSESALASIKRRQTWAHI